MKSIFFSKIIAMTLTLCLLFTSVTPVAADASDDSTAESTIFVNSLDNPTYLEFNKEYTVTVPAQEHYYYYFTLEKSSNLTLNVSGSLKSASYMIYEGLDSSHESEYIERGNIDTIDSNEYQKTATLRENFSLVAGQYCLAIIPTAYEDISEFSLSLDNELSEEMFLESITENNNSIETASEINLDTKIIGQFALNDAKDIYSFNVTEEAIYLFEFPYNFSAVLSLYNENLDKCFEGRYGGKYKKATLTPGKYYYVIENHWDLGDYYLSISKAPLLESCNIELSYNECEYDGSFKMPQVTIRDPLGGKLSLFYFDIVYADNVEAGTASVTITPTYETAFVGTVTKTFEIHQYGEWIIDKEATCIEVGNRHKECVACEKIISEDIAKLNHKWKSNYTIDKGATYAASGLKSKHCSICDSVKPGSEFTIPKLICKIPSPKAAKANLYGYDDVKVTWSKVDNATGYNIYYKKASVSQYTKLKTTTATSFKKANLADGVKYQFKIVPYTTENKKLYESKNYKIVEIYTLKKINKPTVVKNNKTTVRVEWNNINGETGYQISKSTKKDGTNIVATYKTTSGTYKTIKATKGKTYYYKVRAYKVVNGKKVYGAWSSVKAFKLK